jgi:hypothetical protein
MVLDRDRQRRIMIGGTEAMLREARRPRVDLHPDWLHGDRAGARTLDGRRGRGDAARRRVRPESVRIQYEAEAMVLEANRAGSFRTMVVSPGVLASPRVPTPLGALLGLS